MPQSHAVRDIIVVGASAGSVGLLVRLVAALPAAFPAAVFIVTHISAQEPGYLSEILDRCSSLPVTRALDGELIRPGRIYLPQPDYHLLLEKDYLRLANGYLEHYFRPAINPLFRSAAYHYGPRVIGVILTGMQQDGAIGLRLIKEHGGIAIVQDPSDAEFPSMPLYALNRLGSGVDYVLPFVDIPPVLQYLVSRATLSAFE